LRFRSGEQYVDCLLKKLPLAAGEYVLGAGLGPSNHGKLFYSEKGLAKLTVAPRDVYGSGRPPAAGRSLVACEHTWAAGS
jgi:hypothetical protein